MLAVLVFFALPPCVLAQTAFIDAAGKGSIFIQGGGFGRVSINDGRATVAFLRDISTERLRYGLELSGKVSEDAASIFESNQPAPEAKLDASVGIKHIFREIVVGQQASGPLVDDWITFQGSYGRSEFNLLAEAKPFADQVEKEKFDGGSISCSYNGLFKGSRLLGISVGAERKNNLGKLKEVEVRDEVFTSSDGSTTRAVIRVQKARRGEYKESTGAFLYTDYVWFPATFRSRIGIDLFTRSRFGGGDETFEPGIGLFLTEQDAPTRVIGGVSVSALDGDLQVGVVVGFNFL